MINVYKISLKIIQPYIRLRMFHTIKLKNKEMIDERKKVKEN